MLGIGNRLKRVSKGLWMKGNLVYLVGHHPVLIGHRI